jgi:hypothetical protein
MQVLVDSSVWIDYFRNGDNSSRMDNLIDDHLIVINDIIFAELVPFLKIKNQTTIIRLLGAIKKMPLNIAWDEIIQFQVDCLQSGMNGVGIPDLLIAQNAKQNQCYVYSLDKHFRVLSQIVQLDLLETE